VAAIPGLGNSAPSEAAWVETRTCLRAPKTSLASLK
jgi:hypothetical protein